MEWDPVITAVAVAAITGHVPTELIDHFDELDATIDWAALGAVLRRVLAGDHDRERLLACRSSRPVPLIVFCPIVAA